jgi:hypothetical protein
MNKRQRPEAQAIIRASDFTITRLPDFSHLPPSKVDLKFISAQDRLAAAIADFGGSQALQAGGAFAEETESQAILRGELEEELRDINLTAAAIAEETSNPAMIERFRMPHAQNDSNLAASARAIAAAIRELSLNDEFEAHGHPADTATELEAMVLDFITSEGNQGTAYGNRAGATAAIPLALRSGKAALKTLHAIFRRVYKGDLEVLTAWRTASHVQRVSSPTKLPAALPPA